MTKKLAFTISGEIILNDDGLDTIGDATRMIREMRDFATNLTADDLHVTGVKVKTDLHQVRQPKTAKAGAVGLAAVAEALGGAKRAAGKAA